MLNKNLLAILTFCTIFNLNCEKLPLKRQQQLKKDIDECFGKYLATKNENPMDVTYKFSGASKVSAQKAKEQERNLKIIIANIESSAPFKKAINQCCEKIFKGLGKFEQKEVSKTLSYFVDIKELESLCPNEIAKFSDIKK